VVTAAMLCCAFASFCLSRSAFKFLAAASLVRFSESILALAGVSGAVGLMVDENPRSSFIVIKKLHSKLLISNSVWSFSKAIKLLLCKTSF
jgi:hypothetical protein